MKKRTRKMVLRKGMAIMAATAIASLNFGGVSQANNHTYREGPVTVELPEGVRVPAFSFSTDDGVNPQEAWESPIEGKSAENFVLTYAYEATEPVLATTAILGVDKCSAAALVNQTISLNFETGGLVDMLLEWDEFNHRDVLIKHHEYPIHVDIPEAGRTQNLNLCIR